MRKLETRQRSTLRSDDLQGPSGRKKSRMTHSISKAFEVCKGNRDGLMHSDLVWGPHKTVLFKTTKKGTTEVAKSSLQEMRTIADDIERYINYGRALGNGINNQHAHGGSTPVFPVSVLPMPERPPLPRNMNDI